MSIDDKVVSMTFDNANFEKRLAETIKSLDKLENTIKLAGAQNGLNEVAAAANRFDISSMARSVENISNKFSALGAIGFSVIQSLTRSALEFVHSGIDKILDPILQGGKNRAINLENAKFAFEGLGIDVEKAMASAKEAVLGTAFGLDEAAKAAAVFGGAGIKAGKDMTQGLRAIAGVAALTNTSFSEIADIFTSSAATGVVNNQDLQQFATRGLDAASAVAKQLHLTSAQVHEMASEGKLDFATFSKAMDDAFGKHAQDANKTFTGALANMRAAMSRLGAAFFTPFLENQRNLFNALTPAIDKTAAAMSPIVDVFKKLNTASTNNIIKFINAIDFTKLQGPMKDFAAGFENLSADVKSFIAPIKVAFREIFPANASSVLAKIASGFKELTLHLRFGIETADKLRRIFAGVFAVFSILGTVIKELVKFLFGLAGSLAPAGSGFLELAARAGDFLVKMQTVLVKGGAIHEFFKRLGEIIVIPIKFIQELAKSIQAFFSVGIDNSISDNLKNIGEKSTILSSIWDRLTQRFETIKSVLSNIFNFIHGWFSELGQKIADSFKPGDFDAAVDLVNVGLLGGLVLLFKKFISGGLKLDFGQGVFEKIKEGLDALTGQLKAMQTNLKAEALLKIAEAIGIITLSLVALSLIDSAKLTKALVALTVGFGELIGVMTALDKLVGSNVAAAKLGILGAALIEFATAALILSGAIAVLSFLDPVDLAKGLAGIAAGLTLLVAAAKILAGSGPGVILAGVAMTAMALAISVLAGAVAIFATMSPESLAKGLAAVAVGLGLMVAAIKVLDTGLFGGAGAALAGAAMVLIATSLNILAGAVKLFSLMPAGDIAKGLIGIAAALVIIAGAMKLMPLDLPITAAGLFILSVALNIMAAAVKSMASNDLGSLAKGIGAFAAMLLILVLAMNAMEGALSGAAALIVVAVAMNILANVMEKLAGIKVADMVKALGAMAAVMLLLAVASLALTEAIAPMLALGAALTVIGVGFTLLGLGILLLAKGLEALAKTGTEGATNLVKALLIIARGIVATVINILKDVFNALPLLFRLLDAALSQLAETIIKIAPKIGKAIAALITEGLKLIREKFPEILKTGFELLMTFLRGIRDHISEIITAGVDILVNFVNALTDNKEKLVTAAVTIITIFLSAIVELEGEILNAGVNILINFLLGLTQEVQRIIDAVFFVITEIISTITQNIQQFVDAGTEILINLLFGISNNVQKIVDAVTLIIITFISAIAGNAQAIADSGTASLVAFLGALTNDAKKVIDAVFNLITNIITEIGKKADALVGAGSDALIKFLTGLGQKIGKITETAFAVVDNFMQALGVEIPKFADAGFKMMIALLDGIADAIRDNSKRLGEAMANLAEALLAGFGNAFKAALRKFATDELPGPLGSIVGKALDVFGIHSPSKVFYKIGENVVAGLAKGMIDNFDKPISSVEDGANTIVGTMSDTIANISNSLGDLGEFNPTITPVLDLTKVQLAATKIDGLMKVSAITPAVSIERARTISTTAELDKTADTVPVATGPAEVKFEQNIYAPSALSVNDIYRNTKSQIALAKEELDIS